MSARSLLAALAALAAWTALPARADDDRFAAPLLPAYRDECGACHLPYPPGLLPADTWRRQMDGLARHYGTDASLEAPVRQAIADWLAANAGTGKRTRETPAEDRITRTRWFVREHDEVPPDAWTRPAVKSPAQCTACHRQADRGDFDEHAVRIPR